MKAFHSKVLTLGRSKAIKVPDKYKVGTLVYCWIEDEKIDFKQSKSSKRLICQCNFDAVRNEETGLYECSRCGQIVDEFRNEVE